MCKKFFNNIVIIIIVQSINEPVITIIIRFFFRCHVSKRIDGYELSFRVQSNNDERELLKQVKKRDDGEQSRSANPPRQLFQKTNLAELTARKKVAKRWAKGCASPSSLFGLHANNDEEARDYRRVAAIAIARRSVRAAAGRSPGDSAKAIELPDRIERGGFY